MFFCIFKFSGQWEKEIQRQCTENSLRTVIFHGKDRNKLASELHTYDVVITTYPVHLLICVVVSLSYLHTFSVFLFIFKISNISTDCFPRNCECEFGQKGWRF
jgi:hypothetical protein